MSAPIALLILALLATSRRIRGVVSNSHISAPLAPSRSDIKVPGKQMHQQIWAVDDPTKIDAAQRARI
jgi:hypothetical protein